MVDRTKESGAIRGWLLVYVVVLAFITVHGMALTAASIIIYIKPVSRRDDLIRAAERLAILRHNERASDHICNCAVHPHVQEEKGGDCP